MSATPMSTALGALREVTIHVGDVHAAVHPTLVKTLLGSCIAVYLWDPERRVGGMNHFMLPRAMGSVGDDPARFGVHAMDLLIGAIMKAGGDRRQFRAKVFRAGHVLDLADSGETVPRRNIAFFRAFLGDEGFPVAAEDLSGASARLVHFQTDSGRAFVKRLGQAGLASGIPPTHAVPGLPAPLAYGAVTLF